MKTKHCAPVRIIAFTLFLLVWQSEIIFATGTYYCSCYSFHANPKDWGKSNQYCQQNGGNLVSMETEEEYQFINRTLQSLNVLDNEWHIGLTKTSEGWKWTSGQNYRLTHKWVSKIPGGDGNCVKMMKNYLGLGWFDDIECRLQEMFICENNTGHTCPSSTEPTVIYKEWCTSNDLTTTIADYSTTTTSSPTIKEATTTTTATTTTPTRAFKTAQRTPLYSSPPTGKKPTSINGQQTEPFTHTNTKSKVAHVSSTTKKARTMRPTQYTGDENKRPSKTSDSDSFPLVIVTVAIGVVLAVAICLLLFVCYWKRRNKGRIGDKCEKPISKTTSLSRGVTARSSSHNQGTEDGGFPEGVQLFTQNAGEPYVAYAVIHNNLTQQNQVPATLNETAYASIQDESLRNRSSKKNDSNAVIPVATINGENSGNSVGESKSNTEVMYASVDKSKKNNKKNESQKSTQWPSGQQAVYASVDKSKKCKPQAEDAVYAEVGSKDTEKQQPLQITYAELADFNQTRTPEEAVKPSPYQPSEYAVIVGQKLKS